MAPTALPPTRACKTALQAAGGSKGKSLTETMASSLAEALGVETEDADERFKVGGGGYGGGGGASVGTIDDKVIGDKVGKIFTPPLSHMLRARVCLDVLGAPACMGRATVMSISTVICVERTTVCTV